MKGQMNREGEASTLSVLTAPNYTALLCLPPIPTGGGLELTRRGIWPLPEIPVSMATYPSPPTSKP